jgi:siroheme synthase
VDSPTAENQRSYQDRLPRIDQADWPVAVAQHSLCALRRAVKAQLREFAERVQSEVSPLAEEYRGNHDSPVIIGWLERVVAQRVAKAKAVIT